MKQRQFLLNLICALAILPTLQAQSDMDERKFRFGMHVGPNLGWLRTTMQEFNKKGIGSRTGFGYGLMMDYKFSESPNYLFSSGFNITTCGGKLEEPVDAIVDDINTSLASYYTGKLMRSYRMQYVNVPLLLKMRTGEVGYMHYFAAIGGDLAFRTRAFANDDFTWAGVGPNDEKNVDLKKNMQFLRMALNISGGAEYNLSGNTNIYFGLGWHNSFTNAFAKKNSNKILEAESDGFPKLDATGIAITGPQKVAFINYISLDIGVFF